MGANRLSDAGLQRLTAPIRVMKKGLENLQVLDLSGMFDRFIVRNHYITINNNRYNNLKPG